jgi:[protein-PII] uridylyltransferase
LPIVIPGRIPRSAWLWSSVCAGSSRRRGPAARRQLERDGDGRACAEGLSAFQDALIRLAYEFTTTHIYRADNPSIAERMAVVAQGGYGRGLLAPGSDIDLLFLLPYKQTAWGESVAEYMLYLLWDLGFKVGHATRNIDQCIRLSLSDMTIRTALLDSRLLLGDEALYADFHHRFRKEVLEGNARPFVEAKLAEQNARHARAGASRYLVEPNVKDGKGGLRDLHTLHWLAKHLYPDKGRGRVRRGRRVHAARISQLPPLRELPLVGALSPAFLDRAA